MTKRSFALAAILGFVAIALGGYLLWQGRQVDAIPGVTYLARDIDPGPMLHLAEVLSSDALEGRGSGTPGADAARGFIRKRFEVYAQETRPVLDFYPASIVREVNAMGSPAEVLQHVLDVVVPIQNEHFRNPLS